MSGQAVDSLRKVDALAGVTHRWVRQQLMEHRFLGQVLKSQDEEALAAGFLSGLQTVFAMDDYESQLVAYSYMLKRGSNDAINRSAELMAPPQEFLISASGYRAGCRAAESLFSDTARFI